MPERRDHIREGGALPPNTPMHARERGTAFIPARESGVTVIPKASLQQVQAGAVTITCDGETVTLHPFLSWDELRPLQRKALDMIERPARIKAAQGGVGRPATDCQRERS